MEVTVTKGQVRVIMDSHTGEGIEGDYNPDDPNDIPLMRFAVERKSKGAGIDRWIWIFYRDIEDSTTKLGEVNDVISQLIHQLGKKEEESSVVAFNKYLNGEDIDAKRETP